MDVDKLSVLDDIEKELAEGDRRGAWDILDRLENYGGPVYELAKSIYEKSLKEKKPVKGSHTL